jgi:hypothetical protein
LRSLCGRNVIIAIAVVVRHCVKVGAAAAADGRTVECRAHMLVVALPVRRLRITCKYTTPHIISLE